MFTGQNKANETVWETTYNLFKIIEKGRAERKDLGSSDLAVQKGIVIRNVFQSMGSSLHLGNYFLSRMQRFANAGV